MKSAEIAHSIRCLLCTHKDLSLDPQLSYKGLAEAHVCKPRTIGLRQEDLWVLLVNWPDLIGEIRFSERARLKNQDGIPGGILPPHFVFCCLCILAIVFHVTVFNIARKQNQPRCHQQMIDK